MCTSRAVLRLHPAARLLAAAHRGPRRGHGGGRGPVQGGAAPQQWRCSRHTLGCNGRACAAPSSAPGSGASPRTRIPPAPPRWGAVLYCTVLHCTVLCQGTGHRELPLPGDLHHHAHPLHRARVPGLSYRGLEIEIEISSCCLKLSNTVCKV